MWGVFISPDVQEFLDKREKNVAERITKGLKKLKTENPFHFLEHLEDKGHYKYRIGEYRAIIDMDFHNKIIKVQVVDHRRTIYKKLSD